MIKIKMLFLLISVFFSITSVQATEPNNSLPYNTFITENFTGFKIQLFTTTTQLAEDDVLFIKFKNLSYEQTSDNGFIYSMGNFKDLEKAQEQLKVIVADYPNARVIEFVDGKRKNINTKDMNIQKKGTIQ